MMPAAVNLSSTEDIDDDIANESPLKKLHMNVVPMKQGGRDSPDQYNAEASLSDTSDRKINLSTSNSNSRNSPFLLRKQSTDLL